jgi:ketosteroid isomerase-like protein
MSTDPAMNTVRGCYEALARRDVAAFVALLAADCVMYETGGQDVPHSGVYRGPAVMTAVFQRLSELSEGSGRFELQDLFSDGAGAVVSVHRNLARRPDGRTLDTREALLFQVEDGHVKSVRNFYGDMSEVARFWSN